MKYQKTVGIKRGCFFYALELIESTNNICSSSDRGLTKSPAAKQSVTGKRLSVNCNLGVPYARHEAFLIRSFCCLADRLRSAASPCSNTDAGSAG
ncbi:MAG: hypothetical protein D3914_12905 [Candidatus Electrothrix sp. LOE2]|nr:hypothetical protein [Candidatus Electrothrix sp. LOE2]